MSALDAAPVTEAAPGVLRVALALPVHGIGAINSYLLWDDQDGHVLVDCGAYLPELPGGGLDEIRDALASRGARLGDVRALLVTHAHIDHYGLAGLVIQSTGAELWMHASAHMDLLAFRMPEQERDRLRRVLVSHGINSGDDLTRLADVNLSDWAPYLHSVVEPTLPLWGGEQLLIGGRHYEVIHTPGHSRSHVCLWSPDDRLLLSGDHMLPGITPPINFHHGLDDDPLGQFIDGLERIENLDPASVLPGHGTPFREGARRARAIIRTKHRRLQLTLAALGTEPVNVKELTALVYEKAVRSFQMRMAMAEVLGQLAYLRKRGLVERVVAPDGAVTFRRAGAEKNFAEYLA
jgi:glyoxylase-like metal-dependent hydrolase (beta-lactamase superfamily II)